ncbi:translocase of chloroplast 159, chloroplastic-like [Impatiens glandulifera]|uniref:translocase of chloroplast 159, chloroplastic-like n=1 Tax=Impatiens glandulifera TaxID=253017 RepID=UPI001FB0A666|nr:translocase of chloroplast 159, chloroplastic-like [Impatiens glandulifera]
MADPSLPTKVMMYTEEPTLSISSGSSSFLIRANPTLDSDVESTLSLNNSYNGGGDSDFELQGSDTGENEFQSPASIDNEQNPKETIVVFDGNKGIDYSGSVAKDSDFEESLRSDYSSTQEEEEQDDDEDEEEGDNTESDDFVEKANEVIPIRARLTRESDDDDDVSLESGEIDNDYGFLSAVRMPVRVSSTTGIDFEEDEEEDTEFEFEIPPAAMEDVPEKEVKVLSSSEESISNADAISFLEEIKSYTEVEEEDVLSAVEEPNIEETLISEIPPENPLIASIIQEPSFEENVSVKTHFLNPITSEDPHDSEKYDEGNNGTVNNEEEEEVSDNEEKKAEEDLSTLEEPIVVSSIETLNIEETLIPEIPPSSLENPFIASTIQEPNFEDCLNPLASEDPHDTEKDDDTVDDEDQEEEEEMFDLSSDSKPNDDERKKLVKFFRFVHRLGLSSEDSLIEELLFHQMKNPNLESAKEEAKHLEEQQHCQTDFDSSLNILVIGKTGVGKSATINSIFGQERAKVDAFQPETKSVTAISGTINTVKLTIFDTPGLRPSPSEHSINTKILSSIKRAIRNTTPDIILYVDRFQEQTRDQDYLALLTSISRSLGLPIWNSTIVVFTHAGSTPFYGPKLVGDDRRLILVENNNNNGFDIERWRQRLLLMGYSMKLLLLSETEHLFKPDMEFENRFMRLLETNYTIEEDEVLMISSLFVMKMKMEVEAKSKCGKVLFRIKSTDQLQIALLSILPIANAVFRKIFS